MPPRVPEAHRGRKPLLTSVQAGAHLWHVWKLETDRGPRDFNPGIGRGRFHPILASSGAIVPTLYAATSDAAAIFESVFHDVPGDVAEPRVYRHNLEGRVLSELELLRELTLVDLTTPGLQRLRLKRDQLIELAGARHYERTARWAEVLHVDAPSTDGLYWMARRYDRDGALLLFGDRVSPRDLRDLHRSLPLDDGPGLDFVLELAEAADIAVVL